MIFLPPHWRANASVEWQRSDITLAGVFTYIGGSTDDRIQPTVNVESFKSFDIIARTSLSQKPRPLKGVSINFSVLNVFNAMTPYIRTTRSEEHTSEHQSLMRISSAVICSKT